MPDWMEYVRRNLRLPTLPPGREAQIVEDLAQQLDEAYEEALSSGDSEREAYHRARHHISDWSEFSEEIAARERNRMPVLDRWAANVSSRSTASSFDACLDSVWRDLVYGLRTLVRSPAFTAIAITTIAVGVAATISSFSVLYAAFWRPMPYPRSQDLAVVSTSNMKGRVVSGAVSAGDFYDWRAQNLCFTAITAYTNWAFNLTGTDYPERVDGALVSPDFFTVLQTLPLQGRTFRPEEDETGKSDVAVMSDRLWRRLFGDAQLTDQTITLNGSKVTVIGTMPADFAFPSKQNEIWVPLSLSPEDRQNRGGKWLTVLGRLKPGATLATAQRNMSLVAQRLQQAYPVSNAGWESRVVSLHEQQFSPLKEPIALLQAAVVLLFLAACFNIAGLMLARAMRREDEIAIKLLLGATRPRMVRQLAVESTMLAGTGGTIGVVLAGWIVALVRTELARIVPALDHIAINGAAIALGALLSVVSMLISGLIPALRSVQVSLSGRSRRMTNRTLRVRQVLVVSQVAFAIVLAVGAMVMVRSFVRLAAVDPGFNPQNVVAMDFNLPKAKYRDNLQQTTFIRDVLERVRRLPGVIHAGAVSDLPMRQNSMTFRLMREEDREGPKDKLPQAGVRWVTADYFPAMQIALVKGRFLDEHDTPAAPLAAVVNRSMAKRFWPAGDPLGKNIRLEEDERWFSIVGIVEDVKQIAIASDEVPAVYLPYAQKSEEWLNWGTLVVRSSTPPDQLVSAIRSQIHDIDKDQPISKVARLQQYVDDEIMMPRFASAVSSAFSGLALMLALIGLSGIVAFTVSQRTHEIGVRLALGAKRHNILQLMMNEAARLALLGLGIGLLVSFWLVRSLQTFLYGIRATEPFIFAQVGAASVVLTLVACYIPATRAIHIDPVKTLRDE